MQTLLFLWEKYDSTANNLGYTLGIINIVIMTLCALIYLYQNIFIIISLFLKGKKFPQTQNMHQYAYIIAARNEENVIGYLIDSIHRQDYPKEKISIFVVADNCTDSTADIARSKGAIVYERFDQANKGKSHALEFLFEKLLVEYPDIEACMVFDADNLVSKDYTEQMNRVYDQGYKIVASYRNSKNFSKNFLTSGSGFCYLRECSLLHKARTKLNLSSYVSGTGFLVDYGIIKKQNGWPHHLLIEDLQFSAENLLAGEKIIYNHNAIFYDEQPSTIKDSWNQRMRWVKGLYQCFFSYIGKIIKHIFSRKKEKKYNRFELFEIGLFFAPIPTISIVWVLIYNIITAVNLALGNIDFNYMLNTSIKALIMFFIFFFIIGTVMCILIVITDHKRILCPLYKQIIYCFTFFLFIITYAPILLIAPFKNVEWKMISHVEKISIDDISKKNKSRK